MSALPIRRQSSFRNLDWQETVPAAVRARVRQLAASEGLEVGAEIVVGWGTTVLRYLSGVLTAGGSWRQLTDTAEWHTARWTVSQRIERKLRADMPELVTGEGRELSILEHGTGVFLLELSGTQVVVAGGFVHTPTGRLGVTAFFGTTLREIQRLRSEVEEASLDGHVMVWGASSSRLDPEPVSAEDVIMAEPAKVELLGWLDRFCKLQEAARSLKLRLRQGLLLVGPPGTGKTQVVRHLLCRYRELDAHVFMPSKLHAQQDDPFGQMLETVRNSPRASVIVIEDIDHITRSGAVTREFLLNAIDGLLDTRQPVLWVATANDPSGLDPALLDRPGRFGRVVVLGAPDREGRRQMLLRFSKFPMDDEAADRLAALADGLTGAYLREACTSAALRVLETSCAYEPALEHEIEVLRRQRGEAVRLGRELAMTARVGFGEQ